jgi:DNA-binding NarL/FixJ family response regulator
MFTAMQAHAFAERTRRELAAAGLHVPAHDRTAAAALSPQETQVARLAAAGLTNQEIGSELFISPATVEWHVRQILTKLKVRSRRRLRNVLPNDTAD